MRPGPRIRTFGEVFASEMALTLFWIPFTAGIFWITAHFPLDRGTWRRHGAIHAAACTAIIVGRAVGVFGLEQVLHFYDVAPTLGQVLVHSVYNNLFFYWLQAGVAHAVVFAARERRRERVAANLERELARAELGALKAQLHPHFLFNTLHSISELVHADPDAADRMIVRLSHLLRQVLEYGAIEEVSLAEELHCLRPYLEIEQVRLGDRLSVIEDVDGEALDALVPHLVLQPLVENAVRHGISPRSAPGRVTIAARREGDVLRLSVTDDGVGLARTASPEATHGLGIATTKARLFRLYGSAQELILGPAPEGGVVTSLAVPFHRAGASTKFAEAPHGD